MSETKYLETHEWYIVDGESFTVGISDFAQGELGDIVLPLLSRLCLDDLEKIKSSLPSVKLKHS